MSIIHDLGLFEDDLRWEQLATCKDYDTYDFFEGYETDKVVSKNVDEMCLSCPVVQQCFQFGRETKSYGVFGGVYLENGRPSRTMNSHKTDLHWKKLKASLGENVKV
jgi:Transcription factor WhiB